MPSMRKLPAVLVALILTPNYAWAQGADFNADGQIDPDDFFDLADVFGQELPVGSRFDLNGDGRIDINDLYLFTEEFAAIDQGRPDRTDGSPDFALRVDLPGGATMDFALIEPGKFIMGTSAERGNEYPQHQVTITKPFYLGQYEITQRQWVSVMCIHPWAGQDYVLADSDRPAVHISWDDVQQFVERLNENLGEPRYRLPTEAEWEYACRAGTTTLWSFGDDESQLGEYGWTVDNAWDHGVRWAQTVGSKLANPWGLYDMHGNVWEWVQDRLRWYSSMRAIDPQGPETGSFRVLRGDSSFGYFSRDSRSAVRTGGDPGVRESSIGARLLRVYGELARPDSGPDEDKVVSPNLIPTAATGPDQEVTVGTVVLLDGSGSRDPEGAPLSFRWTQTVGPKVVLSAATVHSPVFIPLLPDTYRFQLAVNDGHSDSAPDSTTITVHPVDSEPAIRRNRQPIASAGANRNLTLGDETQLDGSGSTDPDGDSLSFHWTQTIGPTVILPDSADQVPLFLPVLQGIYGYSLIVDDGHLASTPDTVTIIALSIARSASIG